MTLNTIHKTIHEYIQSTKRDFGGFGFAKLQIEFGFVGDEKYPVLFFKTKSMIALGRRLFQTPRWMSEWYTTCRRNEENLPEHRLDGSVHRYITSKKKIDHGMPQIQCFGTTKMATVSARTPKLFTSMFNLIHHLIHLVHFFICNLVLAFKVF